MANQRAGASVTQSKSYGAVVIESTLRTLARYQVQLTSCVLAALSGIQSPRAVFVFSTPHDQPRGGRGHLTFMFLTKGGGYIIY
jgi:hypothetical protein